MKKKTAALTLIGSFLALGLFATAYGSGRGSGYGYYDRGSRYEYRGDYGARYYDDDRYRGDRRYYDDRYRGDRRYYDDRYRGTGRYSDDRYGYRQPVRPPAPALIRPPAPVRRPAPTGTTTAPAPAPTPAPTTSTGQ
ncbi:MAG: hypothetical protein D3904_16320 [Candidatus Electrothrix sp. EH2]|nr:hypothetical protein [Candidatus Electrothrix sp. EH2]